MADAGSRGRRSVQLAAGALILFIAGPALATTRLVPPIVGFVFFALGGALGLVTAITGLIATVRGASGKGLTAIVLGGVPAFLLISLGAAGHKYPPINDISTDLADPPAFAHAQELPPNRGRDMSYPETFKEIVRGAYPDLKPLRRTEPSDKLFDRALLEARAMPNWEITHVDRDQLSFEGVDTSRLFHFQDDFMVRIKRDADASVVDMRSKSRDGKGDLGANANRIHAFFQKLGGK